MNYSERINKNIFLLLSESKFMKIFIIHLKKMKNKKLNKWKKLNL